MNLAQALLLKLKRVLNSTGQRQAANHKISAQQEALALTAIIFLHCQRRRQTHITFGFIAMSWDVAILDQACGLCFMQQIR